MDLFSALSPGDFVQALDGDEITGLFGSYPEMEQINQVKGKLYILGEEGARQQLADRTFYARFGLSVLIFLIVFYALSYLILDPIPLVDELAIATGCGVIFSLWYRKRTERGSRMVQKKIDVKGAVDRIEFRESLLLKEMELYLETLEHRSLIELSENWSRDRVRFTAEDEGGMTAEILKGIEAKLGRKALTRFSRAMGKGSAGLALAKTVSDAPLAAFYHKCRESLGL